MTDRTSPLDAYFLYTEADGVNLMHTGGFALVDGKAPTHGELLEMLAGKLPLIPRYRQMIRSVPFELGRPVWVDAQQFDLQQHVLHRTLPAPGGVAELKACLEEFISGRLDRSRPLWEVVAIDGLAGDQWAIAWKIHHCMIDGVSGTELLTVMFDTTAKGSPGVEDDWKPRPLPSGARLWTDAGTEMVRGAAGQLKSVGSTRPSNLAQTLKGSMATARRMSQPDYTSPLNGPIGSERSYAWATIPFDDVKTIRTAFGGTVNDVLLTVTTAAYADLLRARGLKLDRKALTVICPIALRERDASGRPLGDGTMETKASGLIVKLPLDEPDLVAALGKVRTQMDELKQSGEADAMEAMKGLSGIGPASFTALGIRAAALMPQRAVNTVLTNVQGPPQTLYILGRRIENIFSYAPPYPPGARTSVTVYSYNGVLHFGITGDRRTIPDVDVLTTGIDAAMQKFLQAAAPPSKPKRKPTRARR